MIREGISHALLHSFTLELPAYGESLTLTLRVPGDPPGMRALACMVCKKWDIGGQVQVTRYQDVTFVSCSCGFLEML